MGCGGSKALPPEPALQRRPSSPRALGAAGELNAGPDSPERLAKQTYCEFGGGGGGGRVHMWRLAG